MNDQNDCPTCGQRILPADSNTPSSAAATGAAPSPHIEGAFSLLQVMIAYVIAVWLLALYLTASASASDSPPPMRTIYRVATSQLAEEATIASLRRAIAANDIVEISGLITGFEPSASTYPNDPDSVILGTTAQSSRVDLHLDPEDTEELAHLAVGQVGVMQCDSFQYTSMWVGEGCVILKAPSAF
jgi:hypothetical protein